MTLRKTTICAAALVVAILPTACGAAYADSGRGSDVVEVGDAAATEPLEDGAAAEDEAGQGADQNGDQNEDQAGDAGGEEAPADGEEAAEDDAAAQEEQAAQQDEQDGQVNNFRNRDRRDFNRGGFNRGRGDDGGEKGGQYNEQPGGPDGGEEPPPPPGEGGNDDNGGLDVLGVDCTNSQLDPHNGFEVGPACVDTAFGEVAEEELSPSLLITDAPQAVPAGQDFTITVSTRNLIRDRFLGAADGGYYAESSFLNGEGIQRGHFHTACRVLESTNEAPDAAPAPEFFVATQDNGGGAGVADDVQINVTGIDTPGTVQCSSWAGDGSHRIPMMQRANQTPAFDSVRVTVE